MKRLARAIALTAAVLALTAPEAPAAATRAEYAAQVNPICADARVAGRQVAQAFKRRQRASKRLVEKDPKRGTRAFAAALVQAANGGAEIERNATTAIRLVAAAPGDEQLVAEWLGNRSELIRLGQRSLLLSARAFRLIPPKAFEDDGEASGDELSPKVKRLVGASLKAAFQGFALQEKDFDLGSQLGVTSCINEPDVQVIRAFAF